MRRGLVWMLSAVMAVGPVVGGCAAAAQRGHDRFREGYRRSGAYNERDDRRYRGRRDDRGYYDEHGDYDRHQGGIGPGKGALIGGGAGALLGGLLGGGLKGALIGGGVGAGGGALLGKVHQDHQRDDYRDGGYDRY